jgi:[ribosomal protein S5]-alanine N-acetyltransferase
MAGAGLEGATMPAIPELFTERLFLRPFTLADAPAVQVLAGAAEVAATTLVPHPYPEEAAEAWIASHGELAARGERIDWAIERRADRTLLGVVGLGLVAPHRRGAIGYWLGTPFWNQGYATESARRVVAFGFAELGLHRIEGPFFSRNAASARVLEKIGMRYEGTLRGHVLRGDTFEDVAVYAILRDVWDEQAAIIAPPADRT